MDNAELIDGLKSIQKQIETLNDQLNDIFSDLTEEDSVFYKLEESILCNEEIIEGLDYLISDISS